jgi:hypothetical protein
MKTVLALCFALFCAPAQAAGYAVHGTYLDYGPSRAGLTSFPEARRVPAVLYVSVHTRKARVLLKAPGASCVPSFGASTFVGDAPWRRGVEIGVAQRSSCFHDADDARLLLRFHRDPARGLSRARLLDGGGAPLFEAD